MTTRILQWLARPAIMACLASLILASMALVSAGEASSLQMPTMFQEGSSDSKSNSPIKTVSQLYCVKATVQSIAKIELLYSLI